MTKIAALGGPALLGIGLTAAGSLINAANMRAFQQKQEAANAAWADYQRRNTARFEAMDEEQRKRAEAAFKENLMQQDQENREDIIDAEAERLGDRYTAEIPEIAQDTVANAQAPGRSQVFDDAMARSLADKTQEAQDRIKALARASAFGGGTQFGMEQVLGQQEQRAGEDIGFSNDTRRGNLGTLQRFREVEPEQLIYKPSPLAGILSAAGGMLASGAFSGLGGGAAAASAAPAASIRPIMRPASAGFSFMPIRNPFIGGTPPPMGARGTGPF